MKLKDVYPIWKWSFLGWVIPALLTFGVLVAIIACGSGTSASIVVGISTCVAIIVLCAMGLVLQIDARLEIILGVWFFNKPIAYRIDPAIKPPKDYIIARFVQSIDKNITTEIYEKLHAAGLSVSPKAWDPVTFVTYKSEGQVKAIINGIERRARGLQKGHWCQIEWRGNREEALALTKHELAHVILRFSYPYSSVEAQHRLMKEYLNV